MLFKYNTIYRPTHSSYDNILNYLNLIPLKDRLSRLLSNSLHKWIAGFNYCPELLSLIKFKINSFNSTSPETFCPNYSDKYDVLDCPANLLLITGNTYTFDYFQSSLSFYVIYQTLVSLTILNLFSTLRRGVWTV